MKHADCKRTNRRNTDNRERITARRLSCPLAQLDVFKRLFKKSIFLITVKQILSRMFCFHLIIDINAGLSKGLHCRVKY